jgi:CBS domain-containing membrane protein
MSGTRQLPSTGALSTSACSLHICDWNGSCSTSRRALCGLSMCASTASLPSGCSLCWRFLRGSPFVFPSLGPTAYLFFFSPMAEASSPRNTILGHAIGLICGYAAFALTAASSPPFGAHPGVHAARVLAAALSLSATGALMALFRVSHPPAGATTLIVSLGIISQPKELVIIEVAVILLTAQALAINRLAGIPYPLWASQEPQIAPL